MKLSSGIEHSRNKVALYSNFIELTSLDQIQKLSIGKFGLIHPGAKLNKVKERYNNHKHYEK